VLGDYIHTVLAHIENTDFGTGYLESEGRKSEANATSHQQKGGKQEFIPCGDKANFPYNEETRKAVLSIFLGARIHDAAVMISVADRTMRDRFLTYCKHANPDQFERIYERAVHQGYSTPPVELFQPYVLDFFTQADLPVLHSEAKVLPTAKELAEESLEKAKLELSLARIRLSVVEGMTRILGCE